MQVEHVELEKVSASFSWADNDNLIFMDSNSFEEITILKKDVHNADLLIPGIEVRIYMYICIVIYMYKYV
jgi:translation elongation factor P/translation initiation factor 5A